MSTKKKILICEDDLEIIEVLRIVTRKMGHAVEINTYVDESLPKKVVKFAPDLILMDLRMPVIGGEASIELLREDERTANIPVILISANNDLKIIARKLGEIDHLAKPFSIHDLKAVVKNNLSKEQVSAEDE